jgi:long-chain acyl-CoA synthetase
MLTICAISRAAYVTHGQLAYVGTALQTQNMEVETLISYLPVAHIFECLLESGVVSVGGRIGYFSGDPLRLLEDCQILKPGFFPSVPRVLNRIAAQIQEQMDGDGLKGG